MSNIFVVGIGPGDAVFLTQQARSAMEQADVLCGYTVYIDLVAPLFPEKETYSTPMKKEVDRCRWALETAQCGKTVAMVCSGDAGVYGMAIREFSHCWEVCDDELGVGAIYWSMIASWRSGREASLLQNYREDMNVGHHTAYAFAVRVALGRISLGDALWELDVEKDDLEFSMMAYGVAAYCEHIGERETAQTLYREILERESFWISFGFLAAWNDRKRGRQC